MKRRLLLLLVPVLLACGPKPEERYLAAVNRRLEGDARGYQAELIALAHEAPDSRAGRRARVILQSGDLFAQAGLMGAVSGILLPSALRFSARASQEEAGRLLRLVATYERAHFAAHQRYTAELPEAMLEELAPRTYALFLGAAPLVLPPRVRESPEELAGALARLGVTPGIGQQGFVAAATANLDEDRDHDVWVIDESDNLFHVNNDLD